MDDRVLKLVSPKGIASYPKLNEPDTKFKADGEYSVSLIVEPDEAKSFTEAVQNCVKQYYTSQCQLLKKKELKKAGIPIKNDADKDGNETGKIKIKFTLPARVKSKKTGKEWEQRPALFDTKGKPITERVGGGSVLKVACEVFPWYTPALGVGASLRCKAVQVIDLKSPSGVSNAEAFGFTAEEEGFVSGGESLPDNVFTTSSESKGNGDF